MWQRASELLRRCELPSCKLPSRVASCRTNCLAAVELRAAALAAMDLRAVELCAS